MRAGIIDASRGKHKKKSPRTKQRKMVHYSKKEEVPVNETTVVSSPDSGIVTPQENSTPATTPCEITSKEFGKEEIPESRCDDVAVDSSYGIIKNSVVDMQDNLQISTEVSFKLSKQRSQLV